MDANETYCDPLTAHTGIKWSRHAPWANTMLHVSYSSISLEEKAETGSLNFE